MITTISLATIWGHLLVNDSWISEKAATWESEEAAFSLGASIYLWGRCGWMTRYWQSSKAPAQRSLSASRQGGTHRRSPGGRSFSWQWPSPGLAVRPRLQVQLWSSVFTEADAVWSWLWLKWFLGSGGSNFTWDWVHLAASGLAEIWLKHLET